MEHLDELVVDGSQGHRPGGVKTVAGGQNPGGTGQGHDAVDPPVAESQVCKALAYPGVSQASRAQGDDGALDPRTFQEPKRSVGLDAAVVALRHCYERQVGAGSQLLGNAAGQIEHGQARGAPKDASHAGASGSRRTDENQRPVLVRAHARVPSPADPAGSVTAS